MNFRSFFCFILISCLIFFGCKTQQVINYEKAEPIKMTRFIQTLKKETSDFDHLTFKAKIKPELKNPIPNLRGSFVIENEKKIWSNITFLGISGARFLIEPNQFRGWLRTEKQYIDGDFAYLNQVLKVDFIDYQKLQNLLVGRNFVDFNSSDYQILIDENQYLVEKKSNQNILVNKQKNTYTESFWFHPNFTLSKAQVVYPNEEITVTLEYDNWIEVKGEPLPQNVKVVIKDTKVQQIELEYSNFEFQQAPTPYKVPNGYSKKEL